MEGVFWAIKARTENQVFQIDIGDQQILKSI